MSSVPLRSVFVFVFVFVIVAALGDAASARSPVDDGLDPADLARHASAVDHFGRSLAATGDRDGDGVPDLAVGARTADGGGQVWILSGRDGRVLDVWVGEAGDDFGAALVAADDGPRGRRRLAIGAPGTHDDAGRVEVRSLADGAVLAVARGVVGGDRFGAALGVGDVDGGSLADLVVGAPGARGKRNDAESPRAGAVFVLSPVDLTPGGVWSDGRTGSLFGARLDVVADLDGDGRDEVFIAAPSAGAGSVVWRPRSKARERTWFAEPSAGRRLVGGPVVLPGGEAVPATVFVAWRDEADALLLQLRGLSGEVVRELSVPPEPHGSGELVPACALPDIDGDGVGELAVSFTKGSAWGGPLGTLRVYSGRDGRPLSAPGEGRHPAHGEEFAVIWPENEDTPWGLGSSLCSLGDVDGDGIGDLAAGAPDDGLRRGGVLVVSGADRHPLWWTTPETAKR